MFHDQFEFWERSEKYHAFLLACHANRVYFSKALFINELWEKRAKLVLSPLKYSLTKNFMF